MKNDTRSLDILDLLTKIAHLIFQTENPLSHAYEIVKQTATSQEADISTLFVVEGSRLKLKGGVAYLNKREIELPKTHVYELDWNANDENAMKEKGLTGYVAISGKSMFVKSYDELVNISLHPSHTGKWDQTIYPDGLEHEKTGFQCLYAVPLGRSIEGNPKDTVMGVFKIERRKYRPVFSEQDKKMFDLVAAHLSLLLQAFYRAQNRVFSDVAHAIGGGLGRSYTTLTLCQEILNNKERDPAFVFSYLEKHLPGAIEMLNKAVQRLNLVLDASRDPDLIIEETVGHLWRSIVAEVELKANLKLDESKVVLNLHHPITNETKLKMRSLEYHDLSAILGNLLDNAIRHAETEKPVDVSIVMEDQKISGQEPAVKELTFRVADNGRGIPPEKLQKLENTKYSDIHRLPGADRVSGGTGLRRVFGLVNYNKWRVSYNTKTGTSFDIITPNFLVS